MRLTTLLTSTRCLSLTPGIITELTFTRMSRFDEHLEPLLLPLDEDGGRFAAADPLVLPEDPGIDLPPTSGSTQLIVIVTCSILACASSSTLSGRARPLVETQSLMSGACSESIRKVAKVRVGVGERVARPGNSQDGHLRDLGGHRQRLLHGLLGGQHLGDDAGPRLVGTVILAVAVVALDVAGRGHGHVHPGEVVVGLLGIAGVIVHPVANGLGKLAELVGRTAAGSSRATFADFGKIVLSQDREFQGWGPPGRLMRIPCGC